jgi:hypothetical protein
MIRKYTDKRDRLSNGWGYARYRPTTPPTADPPLPEHKVIIQKLMSVLDSRRWHGFTVAALAVTAIALYAPLIGWGVPHATAPGRVKTFATDEILPLEALAEMRSTFVSPAPDRNVGYPWWHYFVVAAAQSPYLAILKARGDLSNPTAEYPFGLREPVRSLVVLTILGRLVSVLMGAGTVLAAYFFSRTLWGHATGVASAVLTLLCYPMVYYSRTGNLDVPAFFWSAIGLVVFARVLVSGLTHQRAALLGLFAALAVATKDQTFALFVPLGLVVLFPSFNRPPGTPYRAAPIVTIVFVGLGAYVVATGMLVDPQRHIEHVYSIFFNAERVSIASKYFPPAPMTSAGTVQLIREFSLGLGEMFSWPVLIVATVGFAIAVREARWHLLWLLPFVATFVLVVRIVGLVILRYLLPLTLIVDAFAAFAIVRLRRWSPVASTALFTMLVGWRLAIAADLSYAQWHETRYTAAGWLREHVQPGERLEFFGGISTQPALDQRIESRRVMGAARYAEDATDGASVLTYLEREGPPYLVVIPDWTSRDLEYSVDCPPEVYAALLDRSAGYDLVAHFPSVHLLPWPWRRPQLDNPSVAPPVRIFKRSALARR